MSEGGVEDMRNPDRTPRRRDAARRAGPAASILGQDAPWHGGAGTLATLRAGSVLAERPRAADGRVDQGPNSPAASSVIRPRNSIQSRPLAVNLCSGAPSSVLG